MTQKPSTATYAVLGLIAIQPWTGYELAGQAHRSLRFIWPTSEAHIYREQKRLVKLGWASAMSETVGRRLRTRYSVTDAGRAALAEWHASPPGPPGFEIEGLVRTFFGDQASVADLEASMRQTAAMARERLDDLLAYVEDYLDTGGPFPDRLHVVSMAVEAITDMLAGLESYFSATADEVAAWDTTENRGLDATTRERLERVRARHGRRKA